MIEQKIKEVSLDQIQPCRYQPRSSTEFDLDKLQELADSIQSVGLLQPPIVRQISENLYELIAGERRFRAAKLAKLSHIPVIIQDQAPQKVALSALIENIQREDLGPIDTAVALKKLVEEFNLTHQELADYLGMKRTTLSNQLRLLSLPPLMQKALIQKEITPGHAKLLLSIDSDQKRMMYFQIVIQNQLSVRELENKLQKKPLKVKTPTSKTSKPKNIFLQQIEEALQEKLGTKVSFSGDESEGMLSLHYYSLSDLNRLLNEIGYSQDD